LRTLRITEEMHLEKFVRIRSERRAECRLELGTGKIRHPGKVGEVEKKNGSDEVGHSKGPSVLI